MHIPNWRINLTSVFHGCAFYWINEKKKTNEKNFFFFAMKTKDRYLHALKYYLKIYKLSSPKLSSLLHLKIVLSSIFMIGIYLSIIEGNLLKIYYLKRVKISCTIFLTWKMNSITITFTSFDLWKWAILLDIHRIGGSKRNHNFCVNGFPNKKCV